MDNECIIYLLTLCLSVCVFQLDADDAKVTFEEEPGQDVYCESQMPL